LAEPLAAQFEHINAKVIAAQAQQQPVISVDTKKKELIGNFQEWRNRLLPTHDRPTSRPRGAG
jgi:Rhodopirellula transposase DDE domain